MVHEPGWRTWSANLIGKPGPTLADEHGPQTWLANMVHKPGWGTWSTNLIDEPSLWMVSLIHKPD